MYDICSSTQRAVSPFGRKGLAQALTGKKWMSRTTRHWDPCPFADTSLFKPVRRRTSSFHEWPVLKNREGRYIGRRQCVFITVIDYASLLNDRFSLSMPPASAKTASPSSAPSLPSADEVGQLDPTHVRVVDVEHKHTGEVVRHDCYDPNGSLAEGDLAGVRTVFQLVDGEVYVRAIDWARSSSMNPSLELHWVSTGMHVDEVDQVRVFTWPDATLSRVFKHME